MKKNAIVGQSGGPTAVINASLYGVVYEALNREDVCGTIYGMINGIEGLLKGTVMDMKPLELSGELELIRTTPGAYLGSCRYRLPDDLEDEVYTRIFERFQEYNIGFFFYIGGNDSMDTVSKLSAYADKISSDIRSSGFRRPLTMTWFSRTIRRDLAAPQSTLASTVREIALDASVYDNKTSVTIVEIMGRHAGWLTAASALARKFEGDNPVLIYLRRPPFDPDRFIESVKTSLESVPNLVVCISRASTMGTRMFVCELDKAIGTDSFGHKMLTGSGKYLENLVKEKLGVKVRSVELNVSQRCSSAMLSGTDLKESVAAGAYGVKRALEGESTKMVAFTRIPDAPYRINYELKDVHQICNQEKTVPLEWITKEGSDVSQEFIDYALPLIQGSVKVPEENGLPKFAYRKKR